MVERKRPCVIGPEHLSISLQPNHEFKFQRKILAVPLSQYSAHTPVQRPGAISCISSDLHIKLQGFSASLSDDAQNPGGELHTCLAQGNLEDDKQDCGGNLNDHGGKLG